MFHLIGVGLLLTTFTGCVAQEKYNALKLERDGLAEQLGKAQNDASAARTEADAYKGQLDAVMQGGQGQAALLKNFQDQLALKDSEIAELNRRYADAIARAGTGGPALSPQLTNELNAFANANPDLVDFDSARGIVKFKSDVTFATGEAILQPKAKDVISRFSQILNSGGASSYELLVAGHTDNTRVSNPRTIQAGHKDNWYLSSHRAISVGEELMSHQVNSQRLGVVGYADQRPIASNTSESGRAQNRRVEVLILPTTVRGGGSVAGSSPTRSSAPKPAINKDTATGGTVRTDTGPVLNK
jgi:chemotaxis protein MotB